jgi:energy-coupling factor transporter ATP-binding protein EcfA2
VLDFAELTEFVDLKLKNYSSGMLVRLAFAMTVEAEADIMLVDEVLAVGDASFAQKCIDVFRARRRAGRTLVLVTHDMATVQGFCDRAMLIHEGGLRYLGDPEEAATRYLQLNFERSGAGGTAQDDAVRLVDAWLENRAGGRVEDIERGEPIGLSMVVEAGRELVAPLFGFQVLNGDGVAVFGFGATFSDEDEGPDRVAAGQRIRVAGRIQNPLLPGRYSLICSIARDRTQGDIALKIAPLVEFTVGASEPASTRIADRDVGMVSVREDIGATVER